MWRLAVRLSCRSFCDPYVAHKKTFQGAFRCRFAGACIRRRIRSFLACRTVRQISPERAMPHPGHPNFEDCRLRNSGMRAALYHRSAGAEPFRRGGTRCAFRRNPPLPVHGGLSFGACQQRSRPWACDAVAPSGARCRENREICSGFRRKPGKSRDFHETCLKRPLSSGRGGTGVHAPARCGWRVLPSGACRRKKKKK